MPIFKLERQTVVDLAADGYGVLRPTDAPAVLVPFTIEGEMVDVRITHRKRQLWYGEAVAWHVVSPQRTEPKCADFGRCGGCRWQMMSYTHQLYHKRRFVEQALHHIAHIPLSVPPVIPSPQLWRYRNKAEYTFGLSPSGEVTLGFHPRGDFARVLPIQHCWLVPEVFEVVRTAVLHEAQKLKLKPYDPRTHQGLLRSLLVRGTAEEVIALLSLSQDDPTVAQALFAPVRSLLKGYGYFHNPKRNDSIHDLEPHVIEGSLTLSYTVGDRQYRLGPKDFFQVNLVQAEAALSWIRSRLESRIPVLYDLYGGVGFFGVGLADLAKEVYLIEKLPHAAQSAAQNFSLNRSKYPQTAWHVAAGNVEDVLPAHIQKPEQAVAIVDPPREGLHPKLRTYLLQSRFAQIIYISCHPATQARDLADLKSAYDVIKIQPFDFFPHTTSIENIVILRCRG
ncbi:MAG: 23S rRNA (uracil(1939)-C(5))-methyltransferase RlmD [Bacteroidia bacterium]|nr:23S rRNA (uracil(1939)-C(5))-methyltransferase RlmD [Bacteroidia bacterium]